MGGVYGVGVVVGYTGLQKHAEADLRGALNEKTALRRFVVALCKRAYRESTAFARALAWVLFAAGRSAALEADFLTAAIATRFLAFGRLRCGGGFAVCFCGDFVAHG